MKYDEIHESLTGLSYIFTGKTYVNFVQFWKRFVLQIKMSQVSVKL